MCLEIRLYHNHQSPGMINAIISTVAFVAVRMEMPGRDGAPCSLTFISILLFVVI